MAISFFKNTNRNGGNKVNKPKKKPNKIGKNRIDSGKINLKTKNKNTLNKGSTSKPKPRPEQTNKTSGDNKKQITVPSNATVSNRNGNKVRRFNYTKPVTIKKRTEAVKEVEVETVSDERLLSKRPILDTITDLSEVPFFQKISLVNHFRQKESGKIDERLAKEEYHRNSTLLKKETSLLYFLRESAKRNLEHNEVKGYRKIDVRIDPQYSLEDIIKCTESKLLASYNIEIIHNNDLLSKMGVDPIIVRMSLKKI